MLPPPCPVRPAPLPPCRRAREACLPRAPYRHALRRYNNVTPRAALDELKSKDKLTESQAALAQRLTGAQVP